MGYVIGIDEAGYGPNLGPLIVAASVWKVPGVLRADGMYEALSSVVASDLVRNEQQDPRLVLADSKRLYASNKGLRCLERGVQSLLCLLGEMPRRWTELWHRLVAQPCEEWHRAPWHADFDEPVPIAADVDDVVCTTERLLAGLAAAHIELVTLRAVAVFPGRFNELAGDVGSKGVALSRVTIGLLGDLLDTLPASEVDVVCDKHGGRNAYGRLLQERFPDALIEVRGEGAEVSTYRWAPADLRVETRFCCRAERYLPTAVASMTAKYLREMAMRPFNQFWCARVPELKPTAGYPTDARRFRKQIAPLQATLGIEDRHLWRER